MKTDAAINGNKGRANVSPVRRRFQPFLYTIARHFFAQCHCDTLSGFNSTAGG
ncbi:MAG: hypothetical protein QOC76_1691 [Mycobacterium sp.]|nr:hypothetical protein [Mycobacterium sp.]